MAKDPAFLFYTGDFSTGTQFFSDEQLGKYLRLLMAQHQHGHLSENQMIFISKSYDNDIFSKFEKDEKGLYFNKRLEVEVIKRKNYTESRSKNKTGKTKEKIISLSYDNDMENKNKNIDIDNNKDISSSILLNDNEYVTLLLEYGFEQNLILEWFEVRKTKKFTNSITFFKSFIKSVDESDLDKNIVLKLCVEQSWATFKTVYLDNYNKTLGNGRNTTNGTKVEYSDDYMRKIYENLQP